MRGKQQQALLRFEPQKGQLRGLGLAWDSPGFKGKVSTMDFGVVLQTDPPASRVIELAKRAESYGFSYVWTFDSHILWQEPYVIYSQILPCSPNSTP